MPPKVLSAICHCLKPFEGTILAFETAGTVANVGQKLLSQENMDRGSAALLKNHPRARIRDPEELDEYLRTWGYRIAVKAREACQLDARFNAVLLPNITLGYHQYGAQIEIQTRPAIDDYWLLRPLRGQLEMVAGTTAATLGPGHAVLVSPTRNYLFRSQSGSARLNLRLNRAAVIRRLVALLGEPLDRTLEFAPEMHLNEGYGRSLASYLSLTIADLEQTGSILRSPITASAFEEFVLTGLLVLHRHNYTSILQRREKGTTSRDVKRAIDYIEANLDEAIGLPEIAAAAGVPGRTLLQHFRDLKGISPIRYLRVARYKKVRESLTRAKPGESITEIAASWGFSHVGRFSVEYRKRFGESPSETLRRARGKISAGSS